MNIHVKHDLLNPTDATHHNTTNEENVRCPCCRTATQQAAIMGAIEKERRKGRPLPGGGATRQERSVCMLLMVEKMK